MKKISRKELRKFIMEGLVSAMNPQRMEFFNSSFEEARETAEKYGKAYFVNKDNEIIEFEKRDDGRVYADALVGVEVREIEGSAPIHYEN